MGTVAPARTVRRALPHALSVFPFLVATAGLIAGEPEKVRFSRDVLPIFAENCLTCHGPDAKARKADLRLDVEQSTLRTKEPLVVPGKAGESELIRRVETDDADELMPPPKSGHALTKAQKETLRRWVDEGARWGKHWAFEPPIRPEIPRVSRPGWLRNPIDAFVLAKLDENKLTPAPEADRPALIRRLSLDLVGVPPSPAEVDAFLADTTPGAYDRLVDRLLASPRYGEKMALDWLDAARYADTNGYQNDFARTMWPWRDWVIAALNANQPFDAFLTDQVAGDLIPGATKAQKIATGFNRNNRTVTEAGSIDEEYRIENAVDRVETTSTAFLGLTMGCMRCHDHKYDPMTQKEFYQFLGFFNSVNEKGVYTETKGNVPPLMMVPDREQQAELDRLNGAIAAATSARDEAARTLPERRKTWEARLGASAEPQEPRDWTFRLPCDGDLKVQTASGDAQPASWRGSKPPTWAESPSGRAIRLEGDLESFAEAAPGVSLERTDAFSYGCWTRPQGEGACLSKMDDAHGYRGFDLLITGEGKAQVHIVHDWPAVALKVTSKQPIPKGSWSHVFVVHDGSGKASGLKLWVNGRAVEVDVESDALKDSIVNDQPLRIGRRSTSAPFKGEIADVRLYRRALSADELRDLAAAPFLAIAREPAAKRSPAREAFLYRYYRENADEALKRTEAELAGLQARKALLEAQVPTVMVMEDMPKPRPGFLLKRGQYDLPDKSQPVEPGVPACLNPLPKDAPRNRLALARWLTSPDNPLTARVLVNRIWQQHFGNGLVKTAENFGVQGEPPSHPALLDWLATEMIRTGWDRKAMHRLIVGSATYRQSSKASEELGSSDPENRLLARGGRFRLPAELVRDNALAIAGLLSSHVGGPSVKPYQPAGLWEDLAGGAGEGPYVQDQGEKLYRRSLYVYRKRTVPHPVMSTFDAPSREICQVKRARTNTPLQALALLNDVTYVEPAGHLALRMFAEGGSTPADRLAYAFRRATARFPTEREIGLLSEGLDRYRRAFAAEPSAVRQWLQQARIDAAAGVDPVELAAHAASASVILNLDETVTRE
ncbi:Planctomycete cytochrome C [Aquisphaera giovannonii]|uniref:Planctomycete cytochrome C n=1 Tax=Aquisphaera giovannonii TaxID=406548 RepID=A0A5B9VYC1_9BACT|nr:DUF1553 domain-containing protein [Aquisphaera giovannonii]QEH33312.1 Planctomycete cytochrome C [Aquisphaera giovannonii]